MAKSNCVKELPRLDTTIDMIVKFSAIREHYRIARKGKFKDPQSRNYGSTEPFSSVAQYLFRDAARFRGASCSDFCVMLWRIRR
jgi:hypothetical protein